MLQHSKQILGNVSERSVVNTSCPLYEFRKLSTKKTIVPESSLIFLRWCEGEITSNAADGSNSKGTQQIPQLQVQKHSHLWHSPEDQLHSL